MQQVWGFFCFVLLCLWFLCLLSSPRLGSHTRVRLGSRAEGCFGGSGGQFTVYGAGGTVFEADGGRGPARGLTWTRTPTLRGTGFCPLRHEPRGLGGLGPGRGEPREGWRQRRPGLARGRPRLSVWCADAPGTSGARPRAPTQLC